MRSLVLAQWMAFRAGIAIGLAMAAGCAKVGDHASPFSVISVSPAHGARNVAISAPVVVRFNRVVDGASVNADSLRLVHGEHSVGGTLYLEDGGTQLRFEPSSAYEFEGDYAIAVDPALASEDGERLGDTPLQYAFMTRQLPLPRRISGDTHEPPVEPSVAYDGGGNGMAVWAVPTDQNNHYKIVYARYDAALAQWDEERELAAISLSAAARIVASGGCFATAWYSDTKVYGALTAAVWCDAARGWLTQADLGLAAPASRPSARPPTLKHLKLAADGYGGFAAAWIRNEDSGSAVQDSAYAAVFRKDCAAATCWSVDALDIMPADGAIDAVDIAGYDGRWFAAWLAPQAVVYNVYGAKGWSNKADELAKDAARDLRVITDVGGYGIAWLMRAQGAAPIKYRYANTVTTGNKPLSWSSEESPGAGVALQALAAMPQGVGLLWSPSETQVAVAYRTVDAQRVASWMDPLALNLANTTVSPGIADVVAINDRFAVVSGARGQPYLELRRGGGGGGGPRPRPGADLTSTIFLSPADAAGAWTTGIPVEGAANTLLTPVAATAHNDMALIWPQPSADGGGKILTTLFHPQDATFGAQQSLQQREYHGAAAEPAVAYTAQGDVCAAWQQRTNGTWQIFANARVGALWREPFKLSSPSAAFAHGVSVASVANHCVFAWNESDGAHIRRYKLENNELNGIERIETGTSRQAFLPSRARLFLAGNNLHLPVVVNAGGVTQIWSLRINREGEIAETRLLAEATEQVNEVQLAANANALAAAWSVVDVTATAVNFAVRAVVVPRATVTASLPEPMTVAQNTTASIAFAQLAPAGEKFILAWQGQSTAVPLLSSISTATLTRQDSGVWRAEAGAIIANNFATETQAHLIQNDRGGWLFWRHDGFAIGDQRVRYMQWSDNGWSEPADVPMDVSSWIDFHIASSGDSLALAIRSQVAATADTQIIKFNVLDGWQMPLHLTVPALTTPDITLHHALADIFVIGYDARALGNARVPRVFAIEGL